MPSASPRPQRFEQFEFTKQMGHRGGLAARYDECVDGVEFAAATDGERLGAGFAQGGQMLAGVALQRQHADAGGAHCGADVKSRL